MKLYRDTNILLCKFATKTLNNNGQRCSPVKQI